jgi:hypothetical protein
MSAQVRLSRERRMWMHRIRGFVFIVMVVLAVVLPANADITGWSCADDGDGAIVMVGTPTWNEDDYTLSMSCKQYWSPGNLLGDFTTDTELDPSVWILQSVDNYTNFAWTDYHIDIGMNKTFSITSVVTPLGWTSVVTPPVSGQPLPLGGGTGWVGTVDYYVGTGSPIALLDSGDFGLKVVFTGKVAFSTAQTPTGVPEPCTLALLSLGMLAMNRRKRT